jgi:hypothetical protein
MNRSIAADSSGAFCRPQQAVSRAGGCAYDWEEAPLGSKFVTSALLGDVQRRLKATPAGSKHRLTQAV